MDNQTAVSTGVAVALIAVYVIVMLGLIALTVWLYWKIAVKAGYPGAYSLLMLVPIGNLVAIIIFAVTEWPIEKELKRLRGYPPNAPPTG